MHPMQRRSLAPLALAVALLVGVSNAQIADVGDIVIGVLLPAPPADASPAATVARAAEQGTTMVFEEFDFNAMLVGLTLKIPTRTVAGADEAVAAAAELVEAEGAFALLGGYGSVDETLAVMRWAEERGVPFLNVGQGADLLRNAECRATTFHVAPSDAMYVDAISGWYVRSSFRRWFVIASDDAQGRSLVERTAWSLANRHFGARIVERRFVAADADPQAIARDLRRSNADLALLLLDGPAQLRYLAAFEAAGVDVQIAGFPHPETQTRDFFFASRDASPRLGANFRALAFEATLDRYGAREINARYRARFDEPMDPPAWAAYVAVKALFEAVTFGGSIDPADVLAYLRSPDSVFDLWKGIGVSFRPWDRQLRQSLYLVGIDSSAQEPFRLGALVGELPAIYLAGVDPLERLDQLGDLPDRSACTR
jgi:ABC transporter substrate binding protein (PQQ-dependent alcohol dehydrogenase system)